MDLFPKVQWNVVWSAEILIWAHDALSPLPVVQFRSVNEVGDVLSNQLTPCLCFLDMTVEYFPRAGDSASPNPFMRVVDPPKLRLSFRK